MLILFAYLSYIVSEILGFSGIMTLFVSGLVLGHYAFHSLAQSSQKGSILTVNLLSHAAEAFVFIYLGVTIWDISHDQFSPSFTFAVMVGGVVARAASVTIPMILLYTCQGFTPLKLDRKQLLMIWFSGIIRGAIAFGLVL